jgi:hypothetical protein
VKGADCCTVPVNPAAQHDEDGEDLAELLGLQLHDSDFEEIEDLRMVCEVSI